jgi:hypothetical protein
LAQAEEQATTTDAPSVLPSLEYDQRIWVSVDAVEAARGRFRSWSVSMLEWSGPNGVVRTPIADVQRVEVADPIRDGAWKGALGGLVLGTSVGLLLSVGLSCKRDCGEGYSRPRDITTGTLAFGAISAAEGAVVGVLTDLLVHRRRVVYERDRAAGARLVPLVGEKRGAALSIAW